MDDHSWLHNLNPFAFHIGSFGIRWYGLSYLTGFMLAYLLITILAKRRLSLLHPDIVSDFVFAEAVGTVVGGRLGYCIFYGPELLTRFTSKFPFWGVLAVNEGGMASHGGILGIVIAGVWFARKHKINPLHLLDLASLTGPMGIFFGRLANFVNGELVGRPAPDGAMWTVKFPQDIYAWPAHEGQKLEALSGAMQVLGVPKERWIEAVTTLGYNRDSWRTVEAGLNIIVDAIQGGSLEVAAQVKPLLVARYPSQLYEALLEGVFLFFGLLLFWRKARKPGVVTATFFVMYSVVRIIGEQYRMPDAQIGFQALGLTRGQWLSIVMLLAGLLCAFFWARRPVAKIGGWGEPRSNQA